MDVLVITIAAVAMVVVGSGVVALVAACLATARGTQRFTDEG